MCLDGTREAVRSRPDPHPTPAGPTQHGPHHHPTPQEQTEPAPMARLSRRRLLASGVGAAAVALVPGAPAAAAPPGVRSRPSRPPHRVVDLTHVFSPDMPTFGDEKPTRQNFQPPAPAGEFAFYNNRWTLTEHVGTHLDAPGHVIGGARLSQDIAAAELVAPAVVIDITDKAAQDPDAVVTVDDIRAFERDHGPIQPGAAVLMDSGWASRWAAGDLAFRGTDSLDERPFSFPGFDAEACDLLVSRRDVVGVGVDTLSTDPGSSTTFPVHEILGRADRWGLEALAGLDQLPPCGATITVGLVPWAEGSGGPCRVLATW